MDLPSVKGEWLKTANREIIRQDIGTKIGPLSKKDKDDLCDLKQPPSLKEWSISISHTANSGGWLAVPRPLQIGFDVEQVKRIQPAIIKRVCADEEIKRAPHIELLWAAKESFFKALEKEQPKVISQLTISDWESKKNFFTWRGKGFPAHGYAVLGEEFVLSACLIMR